MFNPKKKMIMKKNYSQALCAALCLMFLVTLQTFALDYTISFTGTGKSTTVESVVVQNLTKNTTVTVPTGSTLGLTVVSAVNQLNADEEDLQIFSGLVKGRTSVSFLVKQSGSTQINVFGIDGKKNIGKTENLQEGLNSFELTLPKGAYAIKVEGRGFSYAGKLICQAPAESRSEIAFVGNESKQISAPQRSKAAAASTTVMEYATGDQLLFKGISGNYGTIITDVPTGSKTINFDFVECKDASGNYYSVVKIGTQTWMAENLKTAKYRTTANIPNLTLAADWGAAALVTGAWCYLDNLVANEAKFGKLYNWFAVADVRNIAPTGWHVPSMEEFTTLSDFLGGIDVAGAKLKETGTTYWVTSVDVTNESGFSARAGAKCNSSGVMNDYDYNYLWSSTELNTTNSTCAFLSGGSIIFTLTYSPGKRNGYSVRCLLD